jgi:hypothetical protein
VEHHNIIPTRNILYNTILEMPSRRNSRKNRRNSRKNRRNSRKNGGGLFGKLYGPFHQVFGATGNVVSTVTNTTRNVAKRGLRGVNRVGQKVTGRANAAIRGLLSRRNRRNSRR